MTSLLFSKRGAALAGLAAVLCLATAAEAVIVGGGGSRTTDCMSVFDAPGANSPAPPKTPKNIDCIDGDPTCDEDGLRNGRCSFDLEVCINWTALADCTPNNTNSLTVDHAVDNGLDSRFDPDFQALQQRVDLLGFPNNTDTNSCTTTTAISVPLKAPSSGNVYKRGRKRLSLSATGLVTGKPASDRDKLKLSCRPEGDGVYVPLDLYDGTFDRIRQTLFAQSCALSGCHDSESHQGDLILLPNVAYSQLVNQTPDNTVAAGAGLLRVTPGDPDMSFMYRKITHDLEAGWGQDMPLNEQQLAPELIELVRLWIIGDVTLGAAPQNGWVEGTDQ